MDRKCYSTEEVVGLLTSSRDTGGAGEEEYDDPEEAVMVGSDEEFPDFDELEDIDNGIDIN